MKPTTGQSALRSDARSRSQWHIQNEFFFTMREVLSSILLPVTLSRSLAPDHTDSQLLGSSFHSCWVDEPRLSMAMAQHVLTALTVACLLLSVLSSPWPPTQPRHDAQPAAPLPFTWDELRSFLFYAYSCDRPPFVSPLPSALIVSCRSFCWAHLKDWCLSLLLLHRSSLSSRRRASRPRRRLGQLFLLLLLLLLLLPCLSLSPLF